MARLVAVDGRRSPARPARRGNTLGIQVARDLARRAARGILAEDPADIRRVAYGQPSVFKITGEKTLAPT